MQIICRKRCIETRQMLSMEVTCVFFYSLFSFVTFITNYRLSCRLIFLLPSNIACTSANILLLFCLISCCLVVKYGGFIYSSPCFFFDTLIHSALIYVCFNHTLRLYPICYSYTFYNT